MSLRLAGALLAATFANAQTASHEKTIAELERELAAQIRTLSDWAGLTRYGSDNTEIRLDPNVDRVVFLGDEVTESWGTGATKFFPGKPYFNRGIAGQTTPQMLVRFRQDVIGLKPRVVVILAGANDLAGFAGPSTQGTAAEHLMSMVDLARYHGIRVVLASLTPVCDCIRNVTARLPPGKIIGMNGWLKDYAAQTGSIYLDYYSALVEGRAMKRSFTNNGVIPNDTGYAVMAPLAERAIARALREEPRAPKDRQR